MLAQVFLPLLANASRRYKIKLHGYALLPDRYIIAVSTLPDYDPEHANFLPVKIQDFTPPPDPIDWQIYSVFSYIPGMLSQLNFNLTKYLKIGMERSTPIFNPDYHYEKIHNADDAILAYVKIITEAQRQGFSKDNDYFDDAIMPIEKIGETTQIIFTRPNFLGKSAKVAQYIPLELPLFPVLADRDKLEVQNEVRKLVQLARSKMRVLREEQGIKAPIELEMGRLPQPSAPRALDEKFGNDHYPVAFDYKTLLSRPKIEKLHKLKDDHNQWLKHWRKSYRKSFKRWQSGFRDTLFPLGTCKMRAIHKCEVKQLEHLLPLNTSFDPSNKPTRKPPSPQKPNSLQPSSRQLTPSNSSRRCRSRIQSPTKRPKFDTLQTSIANRYRRKE